MSYVFMKEKIKSGQNYGFSVGDEELYDNR